MAGTGIFTRQRATAAATGLTLVLGLLALAVHHPNRPTGSALRLERSAAASTTTIGPVTTIPATTTTDPPTTVPSTTTSAPPPVVMAALGPIAGGGLAIGDSVLEDVQLYAPNTLTGRDVAIDAAVSRQWGVGEAMLASLRARGRLPTYLVIGLGTNGRVTAADFDAMMQIVAGATRVVFMTVTGPYAYNNPVIKAGVARYPRAVLADWAALAGAHPNWFGRDRIHVGPAGAAALGSLLSSKL